MFGQLRRISCSALYKAQHANQHNTFHKSLYSLSTMQQQMDLSGKHVLSLAKNGKFAESMEMFDMMRKQGNIKIGLAPAMKLMEILIEQASSSMALSVNKEATVALDFGFSIYRQILDDDRVEVDDKQVFVRVMTLLQQFEYPSEKLCAVWTDIERHSHLYDAFCTFEDFEFFRDLALQLLHAQELQTAMQVLQWLNGHSKMKPYMSQMDDAVYEQVLRQCLVDHTFEHVRYVYQECLLAHHSSSALLPCLCLQAYFNEFQQHRHVDCVDTMKQIWQNLQKRYSSDKKQIDASGWNAMAQLYAANENYEELMFLYQDMKDADVEPTRDTFLAMIGVCCNIVNLEKGKKVHLDMVRAQSKLKFGPQSKLLQDIEVQKALLNMYSKCGDVVNTSKHWMDLKKADKEYSDLHRGTQRLITIQHWNCIINALAMDGNVDEVLKLYDELTQESEICANDVTFAMIVDVLNRKGMKEKATQILQEQSASSSASSSSSSESVITVENEILTVNTLSRSGKFDEAELLISKDNVKSSNIMWMTLLSACRRYNDIERAKRIYCHIVEVNGGDESTQYCQSAKLLLANIYGSIKQPDKEKLIRLELSSTSRGFKKTPGMSFIEIEGQQHKFFAHYKGHEKNKEIWAEVRRLTEIMKNDYGYVPNPRWVTRQLRPHESVETYLMGHSERLCFAFANISTPSESKLIIGKNLRFCGDCHDVFKHFSSITGRLILCRDAKRFHHFENGKCSCNDFW